MASSKGLLALPFLLLLPVLLLVLLIPAQPSCAEAVVDAASYDAGKNSLPGQAEPGAAMAPVNQEGAAGVKAVKTVSNQFLQFGRYYLTRIQAVLPASNVVVFGIL